MFLVDGHLDMATNIIGLGRDLALFPNELRGENSLWHPDPCWGTCTVGAGSAC